MPELTVHIDDEEFLKKPEEERSLLIFRAVSCQEQKIKMINEEGCTMAKIRDKKGRRRIVIGVGSVSIVGVGGLVYELIKHVF